MTPGRHVGRCQSNGSKVIFNPACGTRLLISPPIFSALRSVNLKLQIHFGVGDLAADGNKTFTPRSSNKTFSNWPFARCNRDWVKASFLFV
jgi:hypothetical protein